MVKGRRAVSGVLVLWLLAMGAAAQTPPEPAMKYGDSDRLGRPFAKDPCVIRLGDEYRMYYSIREYPPERRPTGAPKGWAIGVAASDDLTRWRKIGEILPEQSCEQNGVVNGRVIALDGTLHLFYNTYGNGAKDALCHATSRDGLHFDRDPSNPIWSPTGAWNNGRAIDVDVVEFGGRVLLYYATRDPSGQVQMLHAIAAEPGSGYGRGAWKSVIDGPVLKPELPWETKCIEAPSALVRDGVLYLFYGGGYNNDPQQIGCARSRDGIHFERLFVDKPLLPNGPPGSWNASESGHPGVFVDADGRQYLFFQANNDRGRTWFLSKVRIDWKDDRPVIVEGP